MRILITGANGFIGRALCQIMSERHELIASMRTSEKAVALPATVRQAFVGDLESPVEWRDHLKGVDAVIHLAARAHQLHDRGEDISDLYYRTNTLGTLRLARQCSEMGISRFIFLSSIGVYGRTLHKEPLTEQSPLGASEPYAISKLKAEEGLMDISAKSGMSSVIVRPPLVYGPNVPGNFRFLLKAIAREIPLPLAGAIAPHSMIGLRNLVNFLHLCVVHPKARNEIFTVSDGEDSCVAGLCERLAKEMQVKCRTFFIPEKLLQLGSLCIARQKIYKQLFYPLQVDPLKAHTHLSWNPPYKFREEIALTAKWFISATAEFQRCSLKRTDTPSNINN